MSRITALVLIAGLLAVIAFLANMNETSLAQIEATVVRYLPIVIREKEIIPSITPTQTERPTRTPTRTQTFTPFPTWTPFRTWTPVPTPTVSPTFTLTPTLTYTPTSTSTPTYLPLPSFTLLYPSPTSTLTARVTATPTRTTTGTSAPYPYPEPGIGAERTGLIFLVGSLWVLLAGWLVLLLRRTRI